VHSGGSGGLLKVWGKKKNFHFLYFAHVSLLIDTIVGGFFMFFWVKTNFDVVFRPYKNFKTQKIRFFSSKICQIKKFPNIFG
jgi:hypothetical protein